MKTYKGDVSLILGNLKKNQSVIFGTSHSFFIEVLIKLAQMQPEKEYIIPYNGNKIQCEEKYNILDLARLYSEYDFPDNILFEEKFAKLVNEFKQAVKN